MVRFEEPDSRTRWDSPLFVMVPEDKLPEDQIWDSVILKKAPPPNMSTVVVCGQFFFFCYFVRATLASFADLKLIRFCVSLVQWHIQRVVKETNYLYEFDQTTQNIIQAILDAQKSGDPTKQIKAPLSSILLQLPPTRVVTLSELRRLRRQFTSINKMHTLLDMTRVAEGFVEYLNQNLNA